LEEAASLRSWHKASKIDEVEEEISEVMVIGSRQESKTSGQVKLVVWHSNNSVSNTTFKVMAHPI